MTHTLEVLADTYDALTRASLLADTDPAAARDEVKAESRLLDACMRAGMPFNEPNHVEWAAIRISRWMVSGLSYGRAA